MENLVKQGLIDQVSAWRCLRPLSAAHAFFAPQPLFTVCLAPPQTVDPAKSFYTFGYVDDSVALASDFTTVRVTTVSPENALAALPDTG